MADRDSPPSTSPTTEKDSIIAWLRGEFTAANAMIDALCQHLAQVGGVSEYDTVFSAIQCRRLHWLPVVNMHKYHSIADVEAEVRKVTERQNKDRREADRSDADKTNQQDAAAAVVNKEEEEKHQESCENGDSGASLEVEVHHPMASAFYICSNHQHCNDRPAQFKLTNFTAQELVKGNMVNVLSGLRLFQHVFTDSELTKLTDFANQLRLAGQNGTLSGDTFLLFDKRVKGNNRELIQFGFPFFMHKNSDACNLEPIPPLLQEVIDHLVQWRLIQANTRPNACIIHFYGEEAFSHPFDKPRHVLDPVAILVLCESIMSFGHRMPVNADGSYRGSLVLPLKQGSLLVMRGKNIARHVMCSSEKKRVSITFFRARGKTTRTPMHHQAQRRGTGVFLP